MIPRIPLTPEKEDILPSQPIYTCKSSYLFVVKDSIETQMVGLTAQTANAAASELEPAKHSSVIACLLQNFPVNFANPPPTKMATVPEKKKERPSALRSIIAGSTAGAVEIGEFLSFSVLVRPHRALLILVQLSRTPQNVRMKPFLY